MVFAFMYNTAITVIRFWNKHMSDKQNDIELSLKGLVLKGAYEDLRPAIKSSVKVADTVLCLLDSIVGLPADFLNYHLSHFRERYKQRLERIPADNRDVPPFRVGCTILKEVAYAAEEPEIQRIFADLLAASCDTRSRDLVHPSFAQTINQLTSHDAYQLTLFAGDHTANDARIRSKAHHHLVSGFFDPASSEDINRYVNSIGNLIHLGLVEFEANPGEWMPVAHLEKYLEAPKEKYTCRSQASIDELRDEIKRLSDQLDTTTRSLYQLMLSGNFKSSLKLTAYGQNFLNTCFPDSRSDK